VFRYFLDDFECSNWPSYYGYHFSCTFPILLFLLSFRLRSWSHLHSWNSSVCWQTCSFFTIMDYDFFMLWRVFLSVFTHSFLKMVTLLSWLFSTYFDACLHRCFLSNSTPISFHLLIVGHTTYHVALFVFLHQYWACWRNVVYCLPILLTSAFAICFCFEYFIAWLWFVTRDLYSYSFSF
jgi:hypothetical protein